jgi:hypothetical protein
MKDNELWSLMEVKKQSEIQKIKECNEYTSKYGLTLSETDVLEIYQCRKDTLKEQERIELEGSIIPKLIFEFCDSSYIYQDNYVEMIEGLQEIFYMYKNESLDELNDDELIMYMKEHFENDCQGSLDYLGDTCLEEFCRNLRSGNIGFKGGNHSYE